jgi:alcohol dehydrogenase (cytochrome c)
MNLRPTLLAAAALVAMSPGVPAQVVDFSPVTEDMLRNPDPGDWPNWRRTDDAWGYSPLTEIDTDNVGRLQLAWAWAMDDTGGQEAAPLVVDGVMYLPHPLGVIQALDAATGDLLWEYRPGVTPRMDGTPTTENSGVPAGSFAGVGRGVQKNIAIYGDMVYSATGNASIVAIDARTGHQVWESQTADPALGYFYTAGPIVADGTVITGITGCERFKDDVCFITGHDPLTGEERWRTSTVARPGEPGGDTWSDLPLRFRAGSDAWIAGSYDPETGLVYWSTSQAKPWARAVRGTAGDALYTNSSLALDPDTGEIVWHYQYLPGETHDMDEVFESVLVDVDGRPSLFKMGKLAILWQIDRVTGEFVQATDMGYQNILDVDRRTGRITYRPGMIPEMGVEIEMCPSTSGFKSWRAMAYSPQTEALYIPITFNCELAIFGPTEQVLGGGGTGPVRRINTPHPASDGNLGELLVLDVRSGEVKWRHTTPSPINTAALTTAGGLVFAGDWDRHMYAYDAQTGEILWQTRLPTSVQGFPISYEAGGKQYVAMPVGSGGSSWSTMLPRDLAPDIRRPGNGNSIHVFALPD